MREMPDRARRTASCSSRPQPDKRETLKRILCAARLEFSAKGLAEARIDEIAQSAGVTKQLVYHYYRSKEELFACVLEQYSADAMSELVAVELDHLSSSEALRKLLNSIVQPYRDPALSSLAQEGIRFHENRSTPRNSFIDLAPELNRKMRETLKRGIEDGTFRPDVDPDLFLTAASLVTTSAFVSRYTVSTLCGLDVAEPHDAETWRRFSIEFVIAAVERERSEAPLLGRPAPDGEREAPA